MAKYCMKCGAALQPDSRFCPSCGTPVAKPSVNEKKNKAVSVQKSSKGKGKLFLVFLLAAAVGFAGFVWPGFFTGEEKPPVDTPVITPQGKTEEIPEGTEFAGSSKALDYEACEGVHVRAEGNAFKQDTQVKITPLDTPDTAYEAALQELEEQGMYAIAAWHVDAGLKDNEVIPGAFEVELDLETLGIDPQDYASLSVVRLGDDGSWYEYACSLEENRLTYATRQNSAAALIAVGGAVLYRTGQAIDWYSKSSYFFSRGDYLKLHVEAKENKTKYGTYEVQWITRDIDPSVGDKIDRVHEIEAECMAEAEEYEKTLQNVSWFSKKKEKTEHYNYLLQINEEYKKLKQEIAVPEQVRWSMECIDRAYDYLGRIAKVRMPLSKVIFLIRTDGNTSENKTKLGTAEKLNFTSIVSLWPYKAVSSEKEKDNYLLTITHELFHICQERYRLSVPVANKLTDDVRFDEMITMVLERDAKEWYELHEIISNDPPLTEKERWDMLRLPADSWPTGLSGDEGKTIMMKEGYQLGDFVMYLQEQYPEKNVTPHKLMRARDYISGTTVSDPLRSAFGMTADEYDLYFRKWLIARRNIITERGVNCFNEAEYKRKEWLKANPGDIIHVDLDQDDSWFMSLRGFKKSQAGTLPCLLIFDDNFRKTHPSINLVPLESSYSNLKNGGYFPNLTFLNIMEIYGSISPSENMKTGYTMYFLKKTPAVLLAEKEEAVVIQLPQMDGAVKAGVIDGYILTVKEGDSVIYETELTKDYFGKSLNLKKSALYKNREENTPMNISVTICEYVKDTNDGTLRGIESDPAQLTIGENNADETVYSGLYLMRDQFCSFEADDFTRDYEDMKVSQSAWPGGNTVRIRGDELTIELSAVAFEFHMQDPAEPDFRGDMTYSRDAFTIGCEITSRNGDTWYARITDPPRQIKGSNYVDATDIEYAGKEKTVVPIGGGRTVIMTDISSPESGITLYFRDGTLSSVSLNINGKNQRTTTSWEESKSNETSTTDEFTSTRIIEIMK